MTKHAILVLGPESSGCRLVARLLTQAGYVGDGAHHQRWDSGLPSNEPQIVWLRSVPHAKEWPNIQELAEQLRSVGYTVSAVVTTRHWPAMIPSQVASGHVPDAATARANLMRAYPHIFVGLQAADVPFVVSTYEALLMPNGVAELYQLLGLLPPAAHERVRNENDKWSAKHARR